MLAAPKTSLKLATGDTGREPRPTRGNGILEPFLARKRRELAHSLIDRKGSQRGSILDVGCGSYPCFLEECDFAQKTGIDQTAAAPLGMPSVDEKGINLLRVDIAQNCALPFQDEVFDAVVSLAVIEHIPPARTAGLLQEFRRILRPNGVLVLTTPAAWANSVLIILSRLGMVSREEIEEHVNLFDSRRMWQSLTSAGFSSESVEIGTFEFGMNIWSRAIRGSK